MNPDTTKALALCDEGIASDQRWVVDPPVDCEGREVGPGLTEEGEHAERYRQIKELLTNGAGEPQKDVGPGGVLWEGRTAGGQPVDIWESQGIELFIRDLDLNGNVNCCLKVPIEGVRESLRKLALSQPPRGSVLAEFTGLLREYEMLVGTHRSGGSDRAENLDRKQANVKRRLTEMFQRAADAPKEGWVRNAEAAMDTALEHLAHAWSNLNCDEFNENPEQWPPTVMGTGKGHRRTGAYALAAAIGTVKSFYDSIPPAPTQDGEER